jgi:hypothetical protein
MRDEIQVLEVDGRDNQRHGRVLAVILRIRKAGDIGLQKFYFYRTLASNALLSASPAEQSRSYGRRRQLHRCPTRRRPGRNLGSALL